MSTEGLTEAKVQATQEPFSDLLILSEGTILAHNLTPAMAGILGVLNPQDEAMQQRAGRSADISVREMAEKELADQIVRARSCVPGL
jgi:hypothetical protein